MRWGEKNSRPVHASPSSVFERLLNYLVKQGRMWWFAICHVSCPLHMRGVLIGDETLDTSSCSRPCVTQSLKPSQNFGSSLPAAF